MGVHPQRFQHRGRLQPGHLGQLALGEKKAILVAGPASRSPTR
ncbi:hypothetical protein BZL29_1707 [Mycobacterium kansasii]|uniref:Uncharacterized protein n=1 Tax=Mycobacterium kansasii TaxID=1768 RepID=A0A1V3XPR0_MYCKA|nr:hypothetical protein BZL29_1707 [Mycobacterium kansasii]